MKSKDHARYKRDENVRSIRYPHLCICTHQKFRCNTHQSNRITMNKENKNPFYFSNALQAIIRLA